MRNLRKYAQQTNLRLFIGGVLILFIVGLGLIFIFYGTGGLLSGFICLLAGLSPIVLIAIFLWGIDLFLKRVDPDRE